jgi:hypothetical protein
MVLRNIQRRHAMETSKKGRILIDLEKLNTFGSGSCPACGKNFELGEAVVPACGAWEGERYIHEDEAVYDADKGAYYERRYYKEQG